jgi:hypothetical protein
MSEKLPCVNCLCIPVCKCKDDIKLASDCVLAFYYIYCSVVPLSSSAVSIRTGNIRRYFKLVSTNRF